MMRRSRSAGLGKLRRGEKSPSWGMTRDKKHEDYRSLLEPRRQQVHVPGNGCREGLSLIVEPERGQVAPRGVSAQQLYGPGREYQPEKQQAEQPEECGSISFAVLRWPKG